MRRIIVAFTVLILAVSVQAQMLEPIRWDVRVNHLKGSEYQLVMKAAIESGWHLYDLKLPEGGPIPTSVEFNVKNGLEMTGSVRATTKPITKKDDIFNLVLSWYANEATFIQNFKVTNSSAFQLKGSIRFMGCNDETCLAPTNYDFEFAKSSLSATDAASIQSVSPENTEKNLPATTQSPTANEQNQPAANTVQADSAVVNASLQPALSTTENSLWTPVIKELNAFKEEPSGGNNGWWILFLSGFLGGLLALLTPCVWPIIPMTVSFFLKRNKNRRKAVQEALIYGLSIVVIYLILGIGITLIFGASALNSLSTNAFFNLLFFALLVVFAISFFGAFELVLPASWTNKVDQKADSTSGILSIFFMAFTLALVSFSCTGPIIGTLLVEAATTGSITGPAVGMFGFALALAIPFALFAVFPNMLQRLPKSGGWLQTVKVVLGFLELAFALKFLSVADLAYGWGILPRSVFLILWILNFGIMGLWLLFKVRRFSVIRTMVGLVSLAFTTWMVPGLWGAPLKAISAFAPPATSKDSKLYQEQLHAQFTDYEAGMAYAARVGKPVFLDFSGFGCVNCRKMENSVWQDPEVRQLLQENYVLITLMVDDKTPLDSSFVVLENGRKTTLRTVGDRWSYLQRHKFGANAQPFYVPISPDGIVLGPSYAYNEDVNAYVNYLEAGLKAFKHLQKR